MIIKLNEMYDFFMNPTKRRMPESVRALIMKGDKLVHGNLETTVMEFRSLRDIFSPDIAAKIEARTEGENIPVLRVSRTPTHIVYHPETGAYLGQFDVKPD